MTDTPVKIGLKYKILKIVPEEHAIIVRYFNDVMTEDELATSFDENNQIIRREDGSPAACRTDYNLNVWRTPTPTEQEIKDFLEMNAPTDWIYLQEKIKDETVDTTMDHLKSIENVVVDFERVVSPSCYAEVPIFDQGKVSNT